MIFARLTISKWKAVALLAACSALFSVLPLAQAATFGIGDPVQATGAWNIRPSPANANSLGATIAGALGTVTGGPTEATYQGTFYQWYQVNWDTGPDGWSVEQSLAKVSTPPAYPDLVVSSLSVNPTSADPGGQVTVSLTVLNQGSGSAASSIARIRLAARTTITGNDPLLEEFTVNALGPNQSQSFTKTETIPSGTAAGNN